MKKLLSTVFIFLIPFIILIYGVFYIFYFRKGDFEFRNWIKSNEEIGENVEGKESIKENGTENKNISSAENVNFSNYAFSYNHINKTYAYDSLIPGKETEFYNLMKKGVYNISNEKDDSGSYAIESITLNGILADKDMLRKVYKAFQYDNPEVFWLSKNIGMVKYEDKTIINLKSVVSADECAKLSQNLDLEIKKIIKDVPPGLSEYERELYLHDLLLKRCVYEKTSGGESEWRKFTIVGAFLDGRAVCEGFSKAIQLLLSGVGIECRMITGKKGSEAHMWNVVKINQNWYHLDATWDSATSIGCYNYFNLDDNSIKEDHEIDIEWIGVKNLLKDDKYNFKLPKCLSMEENYIYKNAITLDLFNKENDNYIIGELKKILNKKSKYLHMVIGKKLNYDSTVDQLFTVAPFKFVSYLREIEKDDNVQNKVDTKKIYFSKHSSIRAVNIELNYV